MNRNKAQSITYIKMYGVRSYFKSLYRKAVMLIPTVFGKHMISVDYSEDTGQLCVMSCRKFRGDMYVLDVTWFRYHPDLNEYHYLKSDGIDLS